MSFALVLCAWIATLQDASRGAGPHAEASQPALQDPARQRVLQRDPRTLPQAPPARWHDFESSSAAPATVAPRIAAMQSALRAGDLIGAMGELHAILDAEPDYPPALHQLGVLYFKLQRYSDGAVALERFLLAAPSKVGETRVLAHCYYSLGEYEKARVHYDRVLAAAPGDVEAIRGLALTHRRLGDEARALRMLDEVLRARPEHVDAWTWKGQILYELGRSEDALAAAQRARDLDPFQPRAWYVLAQILVDLDKADEARKARARYAELSALAQQAQSLETRLELDAHQVQLLLDLARVRVRMGDAKRTRDVLTKLLAERPGDVHLHVFALDALVELGDAHGARVAADALETQCEEDPEAWRRLEIYYASVKNMPKQLQAGERYRRLRND